MHEYVKPENEQQVNELVNFALANEKTIAVSGSGSKSAFGHRREADIHLDTSALCGILDYEPAELVMSVRAGTPLADINACLARHGQLLAFEPVHPGGIYRGDPEAGTIAGTFMANLCGSRRFLAGAARDHLLGFRAVSGRGESFRAGGKVIKNVTGYDLSKLLCGSWGSLAIATELSFKVLPAPADSRTLVFSGLSPQDGLALIADIASGKLQPSGLAYLPEASDMQELADPALDPGYCLVRLEGPPVSVKSRLEELRKKLSPDTSLKELDYDRSIEFWQQLNSLAALRDKPVVLKLSVPPTSTTTLLPHLEAQRDCRWFVDAAGAWIWVATAATGAVEFIERVRNAINRDGGAAVVWKAPDAILSKTGLYSPRQKSLAALQRRIKAGFDPGFILNRGRLGEDL